MSEQLVSTPGPSSLSLRLLPETFAICQLDWDDPLPKWAFDSPWVSITRTDDELSIVCPQSNVPAGILADPDWRCFKVEGSLDLALTGILASLAGVLAEAGISLFAIATYQTDYLLVKERNRDRAVEALVQAGHEVRRGSIDWKGKE